MVSIRELKAGLSSVYAVSRPSLTLSTPEMTVVLLDGGMGEELIRRGKMRFALSCRHREICRW